MTFSESNIIIWCASLDKTLLAPSAHTEQLHASYQPIFNRPKKTSCLTLWIRLKVKFTLQIIYSTVFRINIPAEKENTLLVSGKEAHCKISLLPWKEALWLERRAMKYMEIHFIGHCTLLLYEVLRDITAQSTKGN